GPPQSAQCSSGLSPRVHKGFPQLKTPTEKTCKRTEHSSSVPDQDRRFTSPGPRALKKNLPTAPGGPGGRTVQDGRNAEIKFTATSGLCVCLCVLCCHLYMHVCVRSQPEVSLVVVKREKESE